MDIETLTGLTIDEVAAKMQDALPHDAYKALPGAAGLTDINPAYLWECLTACFGPAGYGWFYSKGPLVHELVADGSRRSDWTRATFDAFTLYYRLVVDGEIVVADGIESNGASENLDISYAIRGATTNALGGAARMLLWQLDIYKGQKPEQHQPPQRRAAPKRVGKDPSALVAKGKQAIAEQPTEPAPHWIEDEKVRRRFWSFAGSIGLDDDTVHSALGVEHVAEFAGTMDEAKEAMERYAKRLNEPIEEPF